MKKALAQRTSEKSAIFAAHQWEISFSFKRTNEKTALKGKLFLTSSKRLQLRLRRGRLQGGVGRRGRNWWDRPGHFYSSLCSACNQPSYRPNPSPPPRAIVSPSFLPVSLPHTALPTYSKCHAVFALPSDQLFHLFCFCCFIKMLHWLSHSL